ncbi:MAG: hypothetical protein U9N85_03205 [Bacteroidota bacterium]|nr:hypothetical protein [Bacteroidota bacterium]
MNKIGAVLIAYFFGLVLGSSGILPNEIEGLQEQVSRVSVLPAIPLFLFPADIRPWLKVAGKTM